MNIEQEKLAAPCGLYCGACSILLAGRRGDQALLRQIAEVLTVQQGQPIQAKDLICTGCLSTGSVAVVCRHCEIRACALRRGFRRCGECPDLPCERLVAFSRDGLPHHGEVLENILHQRRIGLDSWIEEQHRRWRCPGCGEGIDWYAGHCYRCNAALVVQFAPPLMPGPDSTISP